MKVICICLIFNEYIILVLPNLNLKTLSPNGSKQHVPFLEYFMLILFSSFCLRVLGLFLCSLSQWEKYGFCQFS